LPVPSMPRYTSTKVSVGSTGSDATVFDSATTKTAPSAAAGMARATKHIGKRRFIRTSDYKLAILPGLHSQQQFFLIFRIDQIIQDAPAREGRRREGQRA